MDSEVPYDNPLLQKIREHPYYNEFSKYKRIAQTQIDRTTPHVIHRWLGTLILLVLFLARILIAQAYYIVTYTLGIYLLNLFLAFLQPKFDPSYQADLAAVEEEEGNMQLPTSMGGLGGEDDGEFRPFIRRLPEFKFWYDSTKGILIAMFATMFPFLDIPSYWPILVIYFCLLFAFTMRRQIAHMRKYKYIPFDWGRKTRYGRG